MSERKLRIGIVGAGSIVRTRHLPALKEIPDLEIAAVCNSTYESAETFIQKFSPDATPYTNWAELVSLPDIDIVWIGTPPYLHSTVAVSALEAGKHVFCQARMAMNLAEAEEMVAASRRNPHLVTMVCPPPHGMPGNLFMQKLLGEEYLGRPHHIHLRSLNDSFVDPNTPPHWRQRDELSGLNVLTLGIYAEILQRWLGPIASLVAHRKTINPVREGYEVKIPDLVLVLCRFANGIEGALEFSGVAPFAGPDLLEIYGDRGMLSYNFADNEIVGGQIGEPKARVLRIPSDLEQHWTVERDFIAAVRSPATIYPQPGFVEGLQYMKVVQAVADSVEQGRETEVG